MRWQFQFKKYMFWSSRKRTNKVKCGVLGSKLFFLKIVIVWSACATTQTWCKQRSQMLLWITVAYLPPKNLHFNQLFSPSFEQYFSPFFVCYFKPNNMQFQVRYNRRLWARSPGGTLGNSWPLRSYVIIT